MHVPLPSSSQTVNSSANAISFGHVSSQQQQLAQKQLALQQQQQQIALQQQQLALQQQQLAMQQYGQVFFGGQPVYTQQVYTQPVYVFTKNGRIVGMR